LSSFSTAEPGQLRTVPAFVSGRCLAAIKGFYALFEAGIKTEGKSKQVAL